MIKFVNAKINIGLYVTGLLPNGYHTLKTVFYPIGTAAGTPSNPEPFCDILEVTRHQPSDGVTDTIFTGNPIMCEPEKNLVYKSAMLFADTLRREGGKYLGADIRLEKHIPDGAGLGGGSADASFTLELLNSIHGNPFDKERLAEMAAKIGADSPYFLYNLPAMASGIGERLTPVSLPLQGRWIVLLKNTASVSTAEAYRGVECADAPADYEAWLQLPPREWRGRIHNIFEDSVFRILPEVALLKEAVYREGAEYASMSGSGSSVFGIFPDREPALRAMDRIDAQYKALLLCER